MHSYHIDTLVVIYKAIIYIYAYRIYVIFSHVYGKKVLMYTVTPNGIIP